MPYDGSRMKGLSHSTIRTSAALGSFQALVSLNDSMRIPSKVMLPVVYEGKKAGGGGCRTVSTKATLDIYWRQHRTATRSRWTMKAM